MFAALRRLVRRCAGERCEYCRLHQSDEPFLRFHIEHVIARQHGGRDEPANLALACHHCNFHKGPNLSGIDPLTGEIVPLFHPRRQKWKRHFRWEGARVVGRTRSGRATVAVLNMNSPERTAPREALTVLGLHPPL